MGIGVQAEKDAYTCQAPPNSARPFVAGSLGAFKGLDQKPCWNLRQCPHLVWRGLTQRERDDAGKTSGSVGGLAGSARFLQRGGILLAAAEPAAPRGPALAAFGDRS